MATTLFLQGQYSRIIVVSLNNNSDPLFSSCNPRGIRRDVPINGLRNGIARSSFSKKVLIGQDQASVPHRILKRKPFVCFSLDDEGYQEVEGGGNGAASGPQFNAQLQAALWVVFSSYISWLLLLPYAPGDPVWAIKAETLGDLASLSLNFFYILPLMNSVGIDFMEAPHIHPVPEALFNLVMAWSLMFGPALAGDRRRNATGTSLKIVWGGQMFLTNVFLVPYMALRLQNGRSMALDQVKGSKSDKLGTTLIANAPLIGVATAAVGALSLYWAAYGRPEVATTDFSSRWQYFLNYIGSERLAYAFVWDLALYAIFQVWLIWDNTAVTQSGVSSSIKWAIRILGLIPFFGMAVYLVAWPHQAEMQRRFRKYMS